MKKVLALTLVLVLAISMSTVAFAAPATKVHKNHFNYEVAGNAALAEYPNLLDGDADETALLLPLSPAWFYDKDDNTSAIVPQIQDYHNATAGNTTGNGNVSRGFVRSNNIEVKIKWVKGATVFDGASITDAGFIKLAYKDAITSIKDIDYQYQVLIAIGGRTVQDKDAWITVEGTYVPENSDGFWTDDWFRFEGRNFVTPDTYVRNMEYVMNEDEDVTVWGRALKGVKYYGYVTNDWNPSDETVSLEHPEIVGVYHIEQINLKTVTDHVTFNNEDGELYVYNKDLQLLGQVKDKITTLEDTYYLASAQLDVDTEEPDDLGDDDDDYEPDDWGGNSGTGGDDLYPENPHDNPGTGK